MDADRTELLVVLHESAQRAALGDRWVVRATLPPRLLVVLGEAADAPALSAHPAVQAVLAKTPAAVQPAIEPPLSTTEQLFVDAWRAAGRKSGPRPGDGQPWDAPGFEPPGSPR